MKKTAATTRMLRGKLGAISVVIFSSEVTLVAAIVLPIMKSNYHTYHDA